MTLETFFERFELFAGAPNAVGKMRELVLQLAVQGKLVQQDPEEGDADALLKAIVTSRQRTCCKSTEPVATLGLPEPERWHDVPGSWRWVRLGTLGDIIRIDRLEV